MLKNISRLECQVGEKVYHFSCDMDSPILDAKEAMFQFIKYIGQVEDAVKQQQEKTKAESEAQKVAEEEPKIEQLQA